ncbi:ankyrin repeat PH and SEC7 domain containing protein [Paramecium bursaria Chlorella virus OR0704.2.2]|nr:ankyrin repeat PH and SEC7 domain containing protein [Paramecium bursaria Chlorella virus OR0704.2.2]
MKFPQEYHPQSIPTGIRFPTSTDRTRTEQAPPRCLSPDVSGIHITRNTRPSGHTHRLPMTDINASIACFAGCMAKGAPLHHAAREGCHECVKALVAAGADVRSEDVDGWTPLRVAADNGYPEIVRLLLEHGADVRSEDVNGWTPLRVAASEGHLGVVRLLLEHGADVGSRNNGWTPLHVAVWKGHLDIARLLLERGADVVCSKNVTNRTPLHVAVWKGHLDIARLLLERGADVRSEDVDGWTPLHVAASEGHMGVVRLLLERGANVRVKDTSFKTPLERLEDPTQRSQYLGCVRNRSIADFFYLFGLCDDGFKGRAREAILLLNGRMTADTLQRVVCSL